MQSAEPNDVVAEARMRLGTTLRSKWTLERLLGIGGMGAVYAARHRNGLRGAVKVLDPALARSAECRERFHREGRIANEVDDVGAVRVLDDDETEDGCAFLVMELLSGETLDERALVRGGTLPPEEVLRYAAQVLDTLAIAHARGIIHRDIKPENLFLTSDGIVKLLDFGVARMSGGDARRMTRPGEAIGTPAFMSPEQARSDPVDARTDVYALGATMFTLVSGALVHDAETMIELLAAVTSTPARRVRSVADVPEPVAGVIDRALSFDPRARYETAAVMRAAVEQAHVALTGEPVPRTPAAALSSSSSPSFRSVRPMELVAPLAGAPAPRRRVAAIVAPAAIAASALAVGVLVARALVPTPEHAAATLVAEEPSARSAPPPAARVARIAHLVPLEPARSSLERPPSVDPGWFNRRNPLYERRE